MLASHRLFFAAAALGAASLGACSDPFVAAGIPLAGQNQPVESADNDGEPQAVYMVEKRPHQQEVERIKIPFSGVPYLNEALDRSGARKDFRRMEVEIIRRGPAGAQRIKSKFDHVKDKVPFAYDYAIYPGDLIIVTENPATMFDDMIESALGPLMGHSK